MAMQNRTGIAGGGLVDRLGQVLKAHKKASGMAGAAAAGYIMAGAYLFGGVSPFAVALCAALPAPYSIGAALGGVLGYTFSSNPLGNMKYLAAIVLVVAIKWLFGARGGERLQNTVCTLTALVALGISGAALAVVADFTLYDVLLTVAEIFLCAGSAYFFSRTLGAVRLGWAGVTRPDLSCVIVSFVVIIMGFAPITVGGLSLGRILSAAIVLLCARAGGEAGGAVAGITAGIAMGFSAGDYAYAIAAYGFGGLMAGVFGGMGRIATAGSFILVNTIAAIFTKTNGEVYTTLFEVFAASVLFVAIPQSILSRFKLNRLDRTLESELLAQGALQGRLAAVSGVLREISATTREVSQRLGKLERDGLEGMYNRVADQVCAHCGMKTTCWQFKYTDTISAMNSAAAQLKREGSINREHCPKHFVETCCHLEDLIAEINTQFGAHVAREGVQRKVSKVREVITDQFEGMAIMLEELAGTLCGVTLLDAAALRRVREYFERAGFAVRQVRCYTDALGHITAEIAIPEYETPKLDGARAALDLSALLEAEFDLPYVAKQDKTATAIFTEKATFVAEMGAYQIAPEGNRLCGDAHDSIPNRGGRAHFFISDGMGSGGGAAVDSHMATGLLSRLISVGFSHESALKMVNSALLIKSGEESLATIDICSIDLYTGRVEFYKAGAAPTYVVRGGHAGYIESTSLPAGILQGVGFDKSSMTLREGDLLVMVSDGVVATGTDWVKSELMGLIGEDMQRLAERLAMTAKIRRTDGHQDDITVLAVALRKGV